MAQKLSAVTYNGKALIPAPMVSFNRTTHRTEDGHGVGHSMTATLTGKLVSCKGWDFGGDDVKYYTGSGYPGDDTDCCKFDNILTMQDRVRQLFRVDNEYHWFELQSLEGSPHLPHKWLARVQDVQFKEGLWVEVCEFVITLELINSAHEYGDNPLLAQQMSDVQHTERWELQFRPEDGVAYNLTHTISCQAKQFVSQESNGSLVEDFAEAHGPAADPQIPGETNPPASSTGIVDGWQEAKRWVQTRLDYLKNRGIQKKIDDDVVFNLGFLLSNDYVAYNYQRNENVDQLAGNYNVTETWLLSQYPVTYNVVIESDKPRDGDYIVKVHGNFKSFLNSDDTNTADAMNAFKAWDSIGKPFELAQAAYVGARTLNSCPVTRSIIQNKQFQTKPDALPGKQEFKPDVTRTVDFSYEFSDGGDHLCDTEITVSDKYSAIATSDICAHTVTVDGTIQGHKCSDNDPNEPMNNANACLSTIDAASLARAIYTGGKTLILIGTTISRNARKGTIHFTYEYSDAYANGVRREDSVTESWSCENRGSDGKPLVTLQVEGTIVALCSVLFSDLVAMIPTPEYFQGLYPLACILTRKSISKDEIHKKVGYSYTFEEDCGLAKTEVDVTTKNGPDKCGITNITVQFQITGNGCTNVISSTNALEQLNKMNPRSYAPSDYCMTSSTVMKNDHGKINATYEFASSGEAEISLTITETYDMQDCGILKTQVQGHIKGCCGANGGAYAAAERAYGAINLQSLCEGYIISRSKTHNELEGSVTFTLECQKRPHPYIEEKNIQIRCDIEQAYTTVMIEGSITPMCITDQAAQVQAGYAAWAEVSATLEGLAAGACASPGSGVCTVGAATLKKSTVSVSQINGKVQYSNEYACMPCHRVAGTIEESVDIQCNRGGDAVAIVPILGRVCGPLIQNKGTKKETTYTVSIMFRFKPNCCSLSRPSGIDDAVTAIMNSANGCGCPSGCAVVNTYTVNDSETWSPCSGRYTRQITKLLECC